MLALAVDSDVQLRVASDVSAIRLLNNILITELLPTPDSLKITTFKDVIILNLNNLINSINKKKL
jgi:hypothetical protein